MSEESIFGMTPGMSVEQRDAACLQHILFASAGALQAAEHVSNPEIKLNFAMSGLMDLCACLPRPDANPMGDTCGVMIAQMCSFLKIKSPYVRALAALAQSEEGFGRYDGMPQLRAGELENLIAWVRSVHAAVEGYHAENQAKVS